MSPQSLNVFGSIGIFYVQFVIGGFLLNFVLIELNWLKLTMKTPYTFSYASSLNFVLFFLSNSLASLLYSLYKFRSFSNLALILISVGGAVQQCLSLSNSFFLYCPAVFTSVGMGLINFECNNFSELYFKSKKKFFRALSFSGYALGMVVFAFISSPLTKKYSLIGSSLIYWGIFISTIPFTIVFNIFSQHRCTIPRQIDPNFFERPYTHTKCSTTAKLYMFTLIISTFFYGLCFFSNLVVFPHYVAAAGWDLSVSAYSLGFTGISYFFTRLVFAVVGHSRKFDIVVTVLATFILACLLTLIFPDLILTITGQMTYAFLYGFGMAYWYVLVDSITKVVFNQTRLLELNFVLTLTLGVAAGVGVVVSQTLIGENGNFDKHFYFVGGCYFIMSLGGTLCKICVLWGLPSYFDKSINSNTVIAEPSNEH